MNEILEVVIKIPKEDYEFIYDEFADGDMPDGKSLTRTTLYAIAKGTVLPKNHGRLIDADELIKWLKLYDDRYNKRFAKTPIKDIPMYDLGHRNRNDAVILKIDRFPTIIEAESEDKDANSD